PCYNSLLIAGKVYRAKLVQPQLLEPAYLPVVVVLVLDHIVHDRHFAYHAIAHKLEHLVTLGGLADLALGVQPVVILTGNLWLSDWLAMVVESLESAHTVLQGLGERPRLDDL